MTVNLAGRCVLLLLCSVVVVVARASDFMSAGLTPEQVLERLDTDRAPLIVDVRAPVEFGIAHIPGAINVPVEELEGRLDEFRQHDAGVLVYCLNGSRTRQAEAILVAADVPYVYHLEGTFTAWIRGEYPIEKGGVKQQGWSKGRP
jgi:rhodanese-related sulfurtransferase